ncbi:putative thioesterase (yiiD_Cterm) [compost metagenome]
MDQQVLRQYLYDHIPLSQAMEVDVLAAQPDGVVLSAPLLPNINHQATIFGGSASAVAILAAWSLLHVRLQHEGIRSGLVIQSNTMQYSLPISGSFSARSYLEPEADWPRFLRTLARKGRARISVSSVLEYEGQQAGKLTGEFVALASTPASVA